MAQPNHAHVGSGTLASLANAASRVDFRALSFRSASRSGTRRASQRGGAARALRLKQVDQARQRRGRRRVGGRSVLFAQRAFQLYHEGFFRRGRRTGSARRSRHHASAAAAVRCEAADLRVVALHDREAFLPQVVAEDHLAREAVHAAAAAVDLDRRGQDVGDRPAVVQPRERRARRESRAAARGGEAGRRRARPSGRRLAREVDEHGQRRRRAERRPRRRAASSFARCRCPRVLCRCSMRVTRGQYLKPIMKTGVMSWYCSGNPSDMKKPFLHASPIPMLCFHWTTCPGSQTFPKS